MARRIGMKFYFTGKPCIRGHIEERRVSGGTCLLCEQVTNKEWADKNREKTEKAKKQYRERNKERLDAKSKKWREDNPERDKENRKKWYEKNIDSIKQKRKKYREENRESIKNKQAEYRKRPEVIERHRNYIKDYNKNKYANDENYKVMTVMRDHLRRINNKCRGIKEGSTTEVLGYSVDQYKKYLESCFQEDMSWDNYGKLWHIDHSTPITRYIKSGVTDPKIINSLSNLIPMWKEHNLDKFDKTLREWLDEKGMCSMEWELYSKFL